MDTGRLPGLRLSSLAWNSCATRPRGRCWRQPGFTDLANPTSNRIYQSIGYEPVTDVNQYGFEWAGDGR